MKRFSFLFIFCYFSVSAMPHYYQRFADNFGVNAQHLYVIAMDNAAWRRGNKTLPWPWSIKVGKQHYQFKSRGALFNYLIANIKKDNISYGIGGLPLMQQSRQQLWQSLAVDYQLSYISYCLHQTHCNSQTQCLVAYKTYQPKHNEYRTYQPHTLLRSQRFNHLIALISRETGVEPALLHAMITQESAYKVNAKSQAGAMGLMQLMPDTARYLGLSRRDFYNPYKNVKAGALYIKEQLANFGRLDLALAAYNAGPGAVHKYGGIPPYRETQNYVPKVMGYYHYYKKRGLDNV